MKLRFIFLTGLPFIAIAQAQDPAPTSANVAYGQHPKQVLDFYQANPNEVTPLLFFIHGGGWMNGDKAKPDFLTQCLSQGISVVSINYRLIPEAVADGVTPPVKACLDDAARALQFVRSKAGEWRIDKTRILGCGGSAGGFTSLWLAYHPDMAEPTSSDTISRESTRLCAVLAFVPQTSLDPVQMRSWIPNVDYGHHAFSLPSYQDFIDQRSALLPWIEQYSPHALASSDDPPVYLFYDTPLAMGQPYSDPPHSANFGGGLVKRLDELGLRYEFNYPGGPAVDHPDLFGFLLKELGIGE
jgi:acetyl esterase/lipase